MPELFLYELGKLSHDERKRFRRRRYELFASDGVLTTGEQYEMAHLNREYEIDKLNEMGFYHHFAKKDFYVKYDMFLRQALEWGWETTNSYLYSLKIKNEDKLTCIEQLMLEELRELDLIEQEISVLNHAIRTRQPEFILPFPMDENFKQEYLKNLEHLKRFQTVNMNDTIAIPYAIPTETFDDRLNMLENIDIKEEVRICKHFFIIISQ